MARLFLENFNFSVGCGLCFYTSLHQLKLNIISLYLDTHMLKNFAHYCTMEAVTITAYWSLHGQYFCFATLPVLDFPFCNQIKLIKITKQAVFGIDVTKCQWLEG